MRPCLALTILLTFPGFAARAGDDPVAAPSSRPVRLNQIQVIGTHNSYHLAPAPSVVRLVGPKGPEMAEALDYGHRPLAEQFSQLGIRQVELDLYADPKGGRYARPGARRVLSRIGRDPGPDPDEGGRLRVPGPKVFHIQDIDFRSNVATLAEALGQVRSWSVAHPRHVPILIQIELKEDAILGLPTRPEPFGPAGLDAIDHDIHATFPPGSLFTPDDLRRDSATLPEAIRDHGWPLLDEVRGRVLFALDIDEATRTLYLADHPSLRGRAMFVSAPADHPAGAFRIVNDPVRDFDEIQRLVHAGYLVRTRADADTIQARQNNTQQRDQALRSGAQFVSTDFPEPRPEFSTYQVRLPGGVVARPNPLIGPALPPETDLEMLGSATTPEPGRESPARDR